MAERIAFIIKDEVNNYCGDNSFQFDKDTGIWEFVYTENLSNGFPIYILASQAQKALDELNSLAIKLNYKKEFYIKRIDLNKVLMEEYTKNKDKPKSYPFIHETIYLIGEATVIVA